MTLQADGNAVYIDHTTCRLFEPLCLAPTKIGGCPNAWRHTILPRPTPPASLASIVQPWSEVHRTYSWPNAVGIPVSIVLLSPRPISLLVRTRQLCSVSDRTTTL